MLSWQELRQHHWLMSFYPPACVGHPFLGLKAEDSFTGRGESLGPAELNTQETDVCFADIFWIYLPSVFLTFRKLSDPRMHSAYAFQAFAPLQK